MNVLLDTCTFIWLISDPKRLSSLAGQILADPLNQLYLSSVSTWELAVKVQLGRIYFHQAFSVFIPAQRQKHRVDSLPLSEAAAAHVLSLPLMHADPFDRMLICQAIVNDLIIVTPDPLIRQYPQVRAEW